jgi:hypothetical protein
MDRRHFLAASLASWLAAPGASEAQPSFKLPRIGFLGLSSPSSLGNQLDAFRAGLRDLGYVEGNTSTSDSRNWPVSSLGCGSTVNPDNPAMGPIVQAMERTASTLRVGLQQYPVRRGRIAWTPSR